MTAPLLLSAGACCRRALQQLIDNACPLCAQQQTRCMTIATPCLPSALPLATTPNGMTTLCGVAAHEATQKNHCCSGSTGQIDRWMLDHFIDSAADLLRQLAAQCQQQVATVE